MFHTILIIFYILIALIDLSVGVSFAGKVFPEFNRPQLTVLVGRHPSCLEHLTPIVGHIKLFLPP